MAGKCFVLPQLVTVSLWHTTIMWPFPELHQQLLPIALLHEKGVDISAVSLILYVDLDYFIHFVLMFYSVIDPEWVFCTVKIGVTHRHAEKLIHKKQCFYSICVIRNTYLFIWIVYYCWGFTQFLICCNLIELKPSWFLLGTVWWNIKHFQNQRLAEVF